MPISRLALIRRLKSVGFRGPFPGSRHAQMVRDNVRVSIPNLNGGDISDGLLHKILRDAGISREEFDSVK